MGSTKAQRMAGDYSPGPDSYADDGAATAQRYEIPASMQGKYCFFFNDGTGGTMYVRFGDGSVVVDPAARSAIASEALTVDGGEPHVVIPNNQERQPKIDSSHTHMSIIGAAAGAWRFGPATGDND